MSHTATPSGLSVTSGSGTFSVQARRVEDYRIHLGTGISDQMGALLKPIVSRLESPRVAIVADCGVAHHLAPITTAMAQAGVPIDVITVPAGELSKSHDGLRTLWDRLHLIGATRRTLLVALGGGMVCDLVTTAAATYMRGLPYALIPTTVLAQLDAAIGGKGGIDYQGTKNLIGAFHHPVAVVIDPALTATLPDRHIRNGLAEAIKVALIADPVLFAFLETVTGVISPEALTEITRAAVLAKLALLEDDPFEQDDLRRLLNLGHCIGHPLEAATEYQMLHGEAVAAGIAVTAAIAHRTGECTTGKRERILNLLDAHHLPTTIDPALREPVWQHLDTVRRIRNGPLHLVLPREPGRCVVHPDVDRDTYDGALSDLDIRYRDRL